MRRIALLVALPLLASCASLSEEECLTGDWRSIGFADGAAGRTADYIERHREACAPSGIAPDLDAWLAGRAQGLQQYCTPQNAYSVGRSGRSLSPVCSGPGVTELNRAHQRGLRYHRVGQEIRDTEGEIAALQSELGDLAADAPERGRIQAEIARLRNSVLRLRSERQLYARYP